MVVTAQIIDEKSLIKKYQREISSLKQELDQLRRGMIGGASQEEIMSLRQQVCSVFLIKLRCYIVWCSLKTDSVE
jgi:hypothetical protein